MKRLFELHGLHSKPGERSRSIRRGRSIGEERQLRLAKRQPRGLVLFGLLVLGLVGGVFGLARLDQHNIAHAAGGGVFSIQVVADQPSYPTGSVVGWTINYSCSASGGGASDTCDNIVVTMPMPNFMNNGSGYSISGTAITVSNVFSNAQAAVAIWTFVPNIPAGSTGQLHVNWTSVGSSTPNNSIATATASVRDGSTTGTVLATDSGSTTLTAEAIYTGVKLPKTTIPITIGYDYTYTIGMYYSGTNTAGRLDLQNVIYVDYLPPTATYVSSSNGGVYDSVTHSVTWPVTTIGTSSTCSATQPCGPVTVTLRYDADQNNDGDTVTNNFSWSGNGYGDPNDIKTGTASNTNQLSGNIIVGQVLSKSVNSPSTSTGYKQATAAIGDPTPWYINILNRSNVPLAGTLRDVLPCADDPGATSYISDNSDPAAPCQTPATVTNQLTFSYLKAGTNAYGTTLTAIRWWANDGSSGTYTTSLVPSANNSSVSVTMAQLGLASGAQLTAVEVDYQIAANPNPSANNDNSRLQLTLNSTVAVTPNLQDEDMVQNIMQASYTAAGQTGTGTDYATLYVRRPAPAIRVGMANIEGNGVVYAPGRIITWNAIYSNLTPSGAISGVPVQPDWYILIPNSLRYIDGSLQFLNLPSGIGQPELVETLPGTARANAALQNYTLLHLRWADGTALPPCPTTTSNSSCTIQISLQTLVTPGSADGTYGTLPNISASALRAMYTIGYAADQVFSRSYPLSSGVASGSYMGLTYGYYQCLSTNCVPYTTDSYDINGDGAANIANNYSYNTFIVGRYASAFGDIMVQGSQNSTFGHSGLTMAGTTNQYKINLVNASNDGAVLRDLVYYASLPQPGDKYVSQSSGGVARGSDTSVSLTGPVTAPAGVTVYYSTSDNPCRDEVFPNSANAGCTNDWTTSVADYGAVKYLKFVMAGPYGPGEGEIVTFDAVTAADAKSGDMAYMSIAFVATNDSSGVQLLPAESPRVGLRTLGSSLKLAKTVSPVSGTAVRAGDTLQYTITATNDGDVDLHGATVTDNLADVLDDADLVGGSLGCTIDGAACTAPTISGNNLTWTGDIPVGGVATLTYSVTIKTAATGTLNNGVASPDDYAYCAATADCTTTNPVVKLSITKTSNPASGVMLNQGDTITYSVKIQNTGSANLTQASLVDNLSGVAAHATINSSSLAATSSISGNTPAAPTLSGSNLNWSGPLATGETVTLTYTATVKADAYDATLNNAVTGQAKILSSDTTNLPSNCTTGAETGCFTRHTTDAAAPAFTTVKTASVPDGATVSRGQAVAYSIVITNTGDVPLAVTAEDDLTNLLAATTLDNNSLTATSSVVGNTPAMPTVTSGKLSWSGNLAVGEVVTLSYAVTVNSDAFNNTLVNAVTSSATHNGDDVDSTCVTGAEPGCSVTIITGPPISPIPLVIPSAPDAGISLIRNRS